MAEETEKDKEDAEEILTSIGQFCFLVKQLEGFRTSAKVEFVCSKITESIEVNSLLAFDSQKDEKILEKIRKEDEKIKKEFDSKLKSLVFLVSICERQNLV